MFRQSLFSGNSMETEGMQVSSTRYHTSEFLTSVHPKSTCYTFTNFIYLFIISEMTEDEMLDLAMKLSAQEANSAAQRRQVEDNDIQKAIAESLNASDRVCVLSHFSQYGNQSHLPYVKNVFVFFRMAVL